jgi:hypothetical protein
MRMASASFSLLRFVVHRLVEGLRVSGDNQIAAQPVLDVVDLLDMKAADVETIHQRRWQRLNDADQHERGETTDVMESGMSPVQSDRVAFSSSGGVCACGSGVRAVYQRP